MGNSKTSVELAEIRKDIQHLSEDVVKGFKGVHQRQDTTNGKVLKNAKDIEEIDKKVDTKLNSSDFTKHLFDNKNKVISSMKEWQVYAIRTVIGLLITLFVFWLGSVAG